MKILFRLLLLVAVVVGATLYALRDQLRAEKPAPVAGPITPPNVHALGRLEPLSRVLRLTAPSAAETARVEKLLVVENQEVKQGNVLAQFDSLSRKDAAVQEMEAKVSVQRAKLAQIRAGAKPGDLAAQESAISRLEASLAVAEADFRRASQLAKSSALTVAEYDARRYDLEKVRRELEQAKHTLEALKDVRAVDVALQQSEVAAAEAALLKAEADREICYLRAPTDGRVLRIHVRPGESVGTNGVLEFGDTRVMVAVAEVYEADVPRVKLGQRAKCRLFSANLELAGEVAEIGGMVARKDVLNNDPVSDTDARVVEVRIKLDPASSAKVAGLSNARVEVDIEVGGTP